MVLAEDRKRFGTGKLRNIATDLGGAVRGFRDGMKEGGSSKGAEQPVAALDSHGAGAQAAPRQG